VFFPNTLVPVSEIFINEIWDIISHPFFLRSAVQVGEREMPIKKNELKVLRALCRDARRTLEDIGNETGLTGPGVGKIIDRLESGGVIRNYIALPAMEKIGFSIMSIFLFRWDHSKGRLNELDEYLRKTKGIIFASPVEGSNYTHIVVSAHEDFKHLSAFLKQFRTKWDGYVRNDALMLLSPENATRHLNFEVF